VAGEDADEVRGGRGRTVASRGSFSICGHGGECDNEGACLRVEHGPGEGKVDEQVGSGRHRGGAFRPGRRQGPLFLLGLSSEEKGARRG
jgi:hypothetical protein